MNIDGIVMLGRPGSGKSTIGKQIAQQLGLVYVSSGDVARRMAKESESVSNELRHGGMAPEMAMRDEMRRALYDLSFHGKEFVLDGFPRNTEQLQIVRKVCPSVMWVLIDTDTDECISRLRRRGRADDNSESIANRMDYYGTYTRPMIYEIGLIDIISADEPIDVVVRRIVDRYAWRDQ